MKKNMIIISLILSSYCQAESLEELRVVETIQTIPINVSVGTSRIDETTIKMKQLTKEQIAKEVMAIQPNAAQVEKDMMKIIFPVHSTSMSLNKKKNNKYFKTNLPKYISIAVIGNDEYSLDWLKGHMNDIERTHASIMIVEIENISEFEKIQAINPSLSFVPIEGFPLTKEFNLTTYPALITSEGIFQ